MTPGAMRSEPAGQWRSRRALVWLVAGAFFMENLDASAIVPALPRMATSFAVAPVAVGQGVSAYLLTLGVMIPASGWAADRFGGRQVFLTALAIFTGASLLCGLASNLPIFTACRVLQAVGGAMMVPVGRVAVLDATPRERLIRTIAMLNWPSLAAFMLGPVLGGLIADRLGWRCIFLLNLPLGVIAGAIAWRVFPANRPKRASPFDGLGFVLSGGAVLCLLAGADLLARPAGNAALAASSLVTGALLAIAAAHHLRRQEYPLLSLDALGHPTFRVAVVGGSLFRMGIGALPFLLPLLFELAFGYSALAAGAMLTVMFAGNVAAKPLTTPVLAAFGFRRVLLGCGLLNAAALASCGLIAPGVPLAAIYAILFLSGMARSIQFTAYGTVAFADVAAPDLPAANTLFLSAFQLSMGLGVAVAAVAWRVSGSLVSLASGPATPFRLAFALVALVTLIGAMDARGLAPTAGASLLTRRPKERVTGEASSSRRKHHV